MKIKATLAGGAVGRTLDALGLPDNGVHACIYFCEDLRNYLPAWGLSLFTSGLILRLRATTEHDDSMVKLQPCRRSRLPARWLAYRSKEFRLESEWAGERKTLTASLAARSDAGRIRDIRTGQLHAEIMFSDTQREFLADCADTLVDLDALTILGPINAVRWPRLKWQGYDITAERWTVRQDTADQADFLELSVRVEPQGAEIVQIGFDAFLSQHGIALEAIHQPKTRLLLEQLSRT